MNAENIHIFLYIHKYVIIVSLLTIPADEGVRCKTTWKLWIIKEIVFYILTLYVFY
jgi:hypothetical protein